jgi:hypothetical protein
MQWTNAQSNARCDFFTPTLRAGVLGPRKEAGAAVNTHQLHLPPNNSMATS